ncbi:MAG: DUF6596 domain-containing protein [Pseudomonadota bacterium]
MAAPEDAARAAAAEAVRGAYGRLIALISARAGDIAAAEDALSDAVAAALDHWPRSGVPDAPEAWLITAARRKLIDAARRRATQQTAEPELTRIMDEVAETLARANDDDAPYPDDRLKLMFICAHPAIDAAIRTPLMLQTVLGLDAQKIAAAFLVAPQTMSQRLVRAKRKIKDARIPFEAPDTDERNDRLSAVVDAAYAGFTAGYDDASSDGPPLAEEAIYLASLIVRLAPDCAEAHGALALMLYAHARRNARFVDDRYIPLNEQDAARWDQRAIARAERALTVASTLTAPGRFQIEAAIQSAHMAATLRGVDTRADVVRLYDRLIAIAPTVGAIVGKAAAQIASDASGAALETLNTVPAASADRYQPYWAARARALNDLGAIDEADAAYERAISLATVPATRRFLIAARANAGAASTYSESDGP